MKRICIGKEIKKDFDDIKIGDLILYSTYVLEKFDNFLVYPVVSIGSTFLHNHKYILIKEKDKWLVRYYKSDKPHFKVLELILKK